MKKVLTVTMDGMENAGLAVDLPSGIKTQKSTFPYICIANKGKCFCLVHYEVTITKDTVNSQ